MNSLTAAALIGAFGLVSVAAEMPTAGTWKLNRQASSTNACPADAVRNETLTIPADIAKASVTPRLRTGPTAAAHIPMLFDSRDDGKTLVATTPAAPACRLVYEKQ